MTRIHPFILPRLITVVIIALALLLGWQPSSALEYGALIVLATAPFPYSPEYTAIAIAYRNQELIADGVLPYLPVGSRLFRYLKYSLAEGFTLPDTDVGRKSQPNEIEFPATEVEASVRDYGLDDPVPQDDIDSAPPGHDPLGVAVEGVMDLTLLGREKRVADLVFDDTQYAAANKVTLSGTSQWSDFTNSNPISDILTGLDASVIRPNVMVIGRAAWTKLIQHPKIVKATYGDATDAGVARRRDVAELFELEEILVGQAWVNTAKKGQAATIARVWGKHATLFYRNKTAGARRGTTFGFTARFGSRLAGSMPDSKIGLKGGQRVRAGESVKEVITANDLGYHIKNAVA
jgi:hypothetical protein